MGTVSPETAARIEAARQTHYAKVAEAKWWKPWLWTATHDTARAYRYALLAAAFEELDS